MSALYRVSNEVATYPGPLSSPPGCNVELACLFFALVLLLLIASRAFARKAPRQRVDAGTQTDTPRQRVDAGTQTHTPRNTGTEESMNAVLVVAEMLMQHRRDERLSLVKRMKETLRERNHLYAEAVIGVTADDASKLLQSLLYDLHKLYDMEELASFACTMLDKWVEIETDERNRYLPARVECMTTILRMWASNINELSAKHANEATVALTELKVLQDPSRYPPLIKYIFERQESRISAVKNITDLPVLVQGMDKEWTELYNQITAHVSQPRM